MFLEKSGFCKLIFYLKASQNYFKYFENKAINFLLSDISQVDF